MDSKAQELDFKPAETPLARFQREQGRYKNWLARQIGVSDERLSRLLSGERALTLTEAAHAAKALGVALEDLLPTASAATEERQ